jgi:ATP-dependent RNA helicase DDX47/RRP3
MVDEEVI